MEQTRRRTGVLGNRQLVNLIAAGFLLGCGSEPADNTPQSAPSATTSPPALTSPASSSTTPPTSSEDSEPDTLSGSVEFVGVSLDGNSIAVRPVPSVQACAAEQTVKKVQVTEYADSVTVQAVMSRAEPPAAGCVEIAVSFNTVTLLLQQPLGHRAVIDAAAPDTPLVPEIPAGHLEVTFRLEVLDGAIGGTAAPDGTIDFAYAGQVPSIHPIAESAVGGLAQVARTNSDAFSLVIPPTGESVWFGLGRQSPPPGGPFEQRTRDQLASVELPLPAAPGPEVIGQRILIRLEPGAFTTGEQPSIDPTKIFLTWIEPVED